jgi:hypothetical protein
MFIGEPFPNPDEFEKSPLRLIAEKIFSDYKEQGRMAARIVPIPEGCDMWPDIREAIMDSDICFFNATLTGDFEHKTFNPGFELGFSLGMPEGTKKYALAGSHGGVSGHPVQFFNLKSLIPCNIDYFNACVEYTDHSDWDRVHCTQSVRTQLKSCEKRLIDSIFSSKITQKITEIYRNTSSTTKMPKGKQTLFITSPEYIVTLKQNLSQINLSGLSGFDVISPNSFFTGHSSTNAFILNLDKELIKRYDFLVVHLRDENDGIGGTITKKNATIHNFESAIIAGYMLAKYESLTKEAIYLLKPINTSRTFSDYPGYNYNAADFNNRLNEIVQIISR